MTWNVGPDVDGELQTVPRRTIMYCHLGVRISAAITFKLDNINYQKNIVYK